MVIGDRSNLRIGTPFERRRSVDLRGSATRLGPMKALEG
jgi:hypothetical protein